MAVYTYLNDAELHHIAECYGFSSIIQAYPITEGVENTNYLIMYEKQEGHTEKAILTIFEKRVAVEDVPFYLHLKQHLHRKGIPCPLPYLTSAGDISLPLGQKQLAIVSFLQGKSVMQPHTMHVRQAGEMLARMHLAAQDVALSRANALSVTGWGMLLERIRIAAAQDTELAQYSLAMQEYAFQHEHFPHHLPQGIIHADLFPNNVFFDEKGQLSGVIDFYFACHDAYAYDLAIVANAWCFTDDVWQWQQESYDALMEGYQRYRMLTPDEIAAMPVLLRAGALRFLLSRLHDVLYHDADALVIPHNPQEYAEKLMFHRSTTD